MKRNGGIFTFLTIFLSSLASAGPIEGVEQLTRGAREVIILIIQFISDTLLDINSFDEYLFAKILIFTLVLIITYTVIKENGIFGGKKNKAIQWIISSAVSILAIRYIPDNFVEAILLQYSALAVGLTVFLPLMIYFFFIHQSGVGPLGRKFGWMVFAVSFFAMWRFRYQDLGEANLIYWAAIGAVALLLLFDKQVHEYMGLMGIRKIRNDRRVENRVFAEAKLKELEEKREFYTDKEYEKARDRWEKAVKDNLPK